MIALNEANSIGRAIASARGAVDEVVVVDGGSTDGTAAAATAGGAKVVYEPWRDDFGHARSVSLDATDADFVLVLDCDETLDPASVPLVRAAVLHPTADAFLVSRIEADRVGQVPSRIVRLGRPTGRRFVGVLHEVVVPPFRDVRSSEIVVRHHSGDGKNVERLNRYRRLLKVALRDRPDHNYYWTDLAHVLSKLGDAGYSEALGQAVRTLDTTAARPPHALAAVLLDRLLRDAMAGRPTPMPPDEAEALAARWFADEVPLLAARARRAVQEHKLTRAIELSDRALAVIAQGRHLGAIGYSHDEVVGELHLNLGVAYARLKANGPAIKAFERASDFPATAPAAQTNLLQVRSGI